MTAFKRKIFYLSGFDPRGARFYHQLYAEQAALFAATSGHHITVGTRSRDGKGNFNWTVSDSTASSESDITFLGWDDVIREHWVKNPLSLLARSLTSYFGFTRQMDWSHGRRFPIGTLIAFYYPGISAVLLPILFTLAMWALFGSLIGWPWNAVAAVAVGLGAAAFVIRKIQSFWLLRFIIFNDRLATDAPDPGVERRLDEMAATITSAFDEPWDEILFVTHSNGSILAMSIMAHLLAARDGRMPRNFSLMTLGSCIPLIGCRRDSHRFHAQLELVANGDFTWLDLGSLTDGACIALVDPCGSCDAPPRANRHVLSPRWFRYCDPKTYQGRRRNKYDVHFDYLRTFDIVSPLDYIAVTSGNRLLPASIAAFRAENPV